MCFTPGLLRERHGVRERQFEILERTVTCPIHDPERVRGILCEQDIIQLGWLLLCVFIKQDHADVIAKKEEWTFQVVQHDVFCEHSLASRLSGWLLLSGPCDDPELAFLDGQTQAVAILTDLW